MELFDGKYRQEELLGTGAFSEVWKVTYVQTGVTLALKIYKPGTSVDNDGVKMLIHEYSLMVNLNHRNLLKPQFFDICDGRPYLILPYCEKGNISKMIGKMSEIEAWNLLKDTSSALEYLHTRKTPIIHQDIKPANILVASDGSYMLTDFGVSTSLKATLSRLSIDEQSLMSAGTLAYMDPQKFSRKNLPIMANDIWSLGATVFEMLTGELPFGNSGGLLQKKGAEVPDVPEQFSQLLNDTLRSCMDEDPAKRPWASKLNEIATDALKHQEKLVPMSSDQQPASASQPEPEVKAEKDDSREEDYSQHKTVKLNGNNNQNSGYSSVNSNPLSDGDTNKTLDIEEPGIPKWLIAVGVAGGLAAGVLLALFM